ncbi:MAG: tetratricopeptide repeat protein [Bacteroidota bacterium]|nr:tetratricopeptide repeat protein [Bacteroidota bacterium]
MRVLFVLLLITSLSFAQDDLSLGKAALEKKSYDQAIQSFQKFIAANSRNAEAHYYLGETFRQKGDIQNAQISLERSLDFNDEFEPAIASILRVYGKLGLWDKAAKQYKMAQKYHKNSVICPLAFGQTYLELDSLDKASIYFSQAKEIDSKNIEVYIGLSEVYARQNIIVLAVENLRTAVHLDSTSAFLHYKLALSILKNRSLNATQITEVMLHLQESIRLDPTNDKVIYDAAYTMYRTKVYWREAAEFFKKYTELKKDNVDAWEMYAVSLYNAKIYLEAIPALEQSIKLNSKNKELKSMLGHSYYLAKEYQKSLDLYKTFIVDSLSAEEMYRMGYSYFQVKDTINAINFLEKTLNLDSSNSDAIGTLAAIFLNQKRYDKAVVQYEKLLVKDQKNITALYWTAYSYFVLDKIDTAKNYYKRIVALRPNNPQYHQSLVQIYSLQDSVDKGRYHATLMIGLADSIMKADPTKTVLQTQLIIGAYKSLALFEYKDKNIPGAIEKLEKGLTYEKEKKDEGLHLFLAQMLAVQSGDLQLTSAEAKAIRARSCAEYQLVLKINPKNQSAKKESTQMNCGK